MSLPTRNNEVLEDIVSTVYILDGEQITPATTTVSIEGMMLTAIIDTGACDSVVSIKTIDMLRMREAISKGSRRLKDANGKFIPLLGSI